MGWVKRRRWTRLRLPEWALRTQSSFGLGASVTALDLLTAFPYFGAIVPRTGARGYRALSPAALRCSRSRRGSPWSCAAQTGLPAVIRAPSRCRMTPFPRRSSRAASRSYFERWKHGNRNPVADHCIDVTGRAVRPATTSACVAKPGEQLGGCDRDRSVPLIAADWRPGGSVTYACFVGSGWAWALRAASPKRIGLAVGRSGRVDPGGAGAMRQRERGCRDRA